MCNFYDNQNELAKVKKKREDSRHDNKTVDDLRAAIDDKDKDATHQVIANNICVEQQGVDESIPMHFTHIAFISSECCPSYLRRYCLYNAAISY